MISINIVDHGIVTTGIAKTKSATRLFLSNNNFIAQGNNNKNCNG